MRATGKAKTVIWRWQERFGEEGVAGLWRDKTGPSRIPPLSPAVAERVVALTLAGPPPTVSHWTGAAMAKAAGISVSSVQRIWRAHGLRPHLVRRFNLSNDPQFAAKLKEIVDLKKALDELELGLSGTAKPGEAARVGQLTGAKLLLTGSVIQADKKLYLVARLIGAETGRIAAASVEGKVDDELGPLVEKLAGQVADKLKEADKLVAAPASTADRLAALKQKLKKGDRPVVWVKVTERHVGQPAVDPAAQTELIAFLKGTGFEVVDAEEGNQGQADLLIKGEAFSESAGRTGDIVTVKVRVEIKVVDRKTDRVVAVERQTAVAADVAEQSAGKVALEDAAAAIAERLLPKLVKE